MARRPSARSGSTAGMALLSSVIVHASAQTLRDIDPDRDLGREETERAAYEFIRSHFDEHRVLPTLRIVRENTGIRLPEVERDQPPEYYYRRVRQRAMVRGIMDPYN